MEQSIKNTQDECQMPNILKGINIKTIRENKKK